MGKIVVTKIGFVLRVCLCVDVCVDVCVYYRELQMQ
jgi:hypothetical protein